MRQLSFVAATAALAAGAFAGAADAAPVVVFQNGGTRTQDERALEGRSARLPTPAGGRKPAARVSARSKDAVRRSVERAHLAGQISSDQRYQYLTDYRAAQRLVKALSGQRRIELAYVVATLERIARAGRLKAARMPALFLILDRNREWWAAKSAPASGARVRFNGSSLLFQYYPGRGLQLQPLANFGLANGYYQGHRDEALRSLIDELVALRVRRGSFAVWEYYFHFGGGSPPWISGMAQATGIQALARASERLGDPRLLEVARQGLGAFERNTPEGVRVPTGAGAWYALYSFAPRLYVLNGMLQSLIGLTTYVSHSGDARGLALLEKGHTATQGRIRAYDTGAWSLYSRYPGRPGPEADLNYHKLNRDFSRRLCRATDARQYCNAADNFGRYLREPPDLEPHRAVPAPARAGRGVRFRFKLSKVGRVGITVRAEGRTYLSTSAGFGRGDRYFRWVPPRTARERTYEYRLFARDLAGNTASATGSVRVKGR